jgi:hypothetical protein
MPVRERKAVGQPSVGLGFGDAPSLRHSPLSGKPGLRPESSVIYRL